MLGSQLHIRCITFPAGVAEYTAWYKKIQQVNYWCAAEAIFCCPTENSHHLRWYAQSESIIIKTHSKTIVLQDYRFYLLVFLCIHTHMQQLKQGFHFLLEHNSFTKSFLNFLLQFHNLLLKVPSHQIRLARKWYCWIGLDKYIDRGW